MTLDDLDPLLNSPKRLAAMGMLVAVTKIEFGALRDQLGLSDSDLSKQLKALTDGGYLTSERTGKGRTRKSWFSITDAGRSALGAHAAALQRLIAPPAATVQARTANSNH